MCEYISYMHTRKGKATAKLIDMRRSRLEAEYELNLAANGRVGSTTAVQVTIGPGVTSGQLGTFMDSKAR